MELVFKGSWIKIRIKKKVFGWRRFSDEEGFQMKKILRITITADWDKAGFQMKKISRWRWLIFCRWRRFVDGVYWYEGSYIRRLKRLCVRRYVLGSFLAFFFIFDHYFCIYIYIYTQFEGQVSSGSGSIENSGDFCLQLVITFHEIYIFAWFWGFLKELDS